MELQLAPLHGLSALGLDYRHSNFCLFPLPTLQWSVFHVSVMKFRLKSISCELNQRKEKKERTEGRKEELTAFYVGLSRTEFGRYKKVDLPIRLLPDHPGVPVAMSLVEHLVVHFGEIVKYFSQLLPVCVTACLEEIFPTV